MKNAILMTAILSLAAVVSCGKDDDVVRQKWTGQQIADSWT